MSPLPSSLPLPDAEAQCRQLADLIRPHLHKNPALVGIFSGGAWIAERLKELLGLPEDIGLIDVSFYRDDFAEKGLHPQVKPTVIPFDVEGRHLILVDDVLYTGPHHPRRDQRTVRLRPPGLDRTGRAGRPWRARIAGGADLLCLGCRLNEGESLVLAKQDDGQLAWRLENA
jgi:pyrimidine operon attenuation protein/uracil phosphoribosyltransferase